MPYFDQTRTQEPYRAAFRPEETKAIPIPVDEDGDRVYTEDDYAMPADGEAFLPDEEGDAVFSEPAYPSSYSGSYSTLLPDTGEDDEDFLDDDYLDEAYLTEEERQELRRSNWQLLSGLADFAGIVLGTAAILVIIALLMSLIHWLADDIGQTFTLWQGRL